MLHYVHRGHTGYSGLEPQDGHLDFHTSELCTQDVLLARPFKLCVNNLASTDLVTLTLFQGQKCLRNIHCIFFFF